MIAKNEKQAWWMWTNFENMLLHARKHALTQKMLVQCVITNRCLKNLKKAQSHKSTSWMTSKLAAPARPTFTNRGLMRVFFAKSWNFCGIVALNRMVWRGRRNLSMMLCTCIDTENNNKWETTQKWVHSSAKSGSNDRARWPHQQSNETQQTLKYMVRTSSSKPRSSMRSPSSSTRYLQMSMFSL